RCCGLGVDAVNVAVFRCCGLGDDAVNVAVFRCCGLGDDAVNVAVCRCCGLGVDAVNVAVFRCCGLGDDAVLFRSPLHASPGEAGEVRRSPAVLCHCPAHRHKEAGGKFCLQVCFFISLHFLSYFYTPKD
ncbi:MAG: hypothetical protein ACK55Z_08625, partial [bacterium]